jgi:peptidoglycan hydrolase CwlO-like protein
MNRKMSMPCSTSSLAHTIPLQPLAPIGPQSAMPPQVQQQKDQTQRQQQQQQYDAQVASLEFQIKQLTMQQQQQNPFQVPPLFPVSFPTRPLTQSNHQNSGNTMPPHNMHSLQQQDQLHAQQQILQQQQSQLHQQYSHQNYQFAPNLPQQPLDDRFQQAALVNSDSAQYVQNLPAGVSHTQATTPNLQPNAQTLPPHPSMMSQYLGNTGSLLSTVLPSSGLPTCSVNGSLPQPGGGGSLLGAVNPANGMPASVNGSQPPPQPPT